METVSHRKPVATIESFPETALHIKAALNTRPSLQWRHNDLQSSANEPWSESDTKKIALFGFNCVPFQCHWLTRKFALFFPRFLRLVPVRHV